ncbi:MAG: hypothetical protein KJZ87_11245 [Thermoguttaceae bacterium]|nr:hypothetical protein [Thermoguttaceae bacterium]
MSTRAIRPALGYTLLEVILSLSLMSLVLLCVAMAIDFQLRVADAGRTNIEEAQLARVLLHRIADDLRAAITVSADASASTGGSASGSSDSSSASSGGDGNEGGQDQAGGREGGSGGGGGGESAGQDETGGASSSATVEMGAVSGASGSVVPQTTPGVYGGLDWLQVDISRLPRPDQVKAAIEPADGTLLPVSLTDAKTVAYYLASPDDSESADPLDPSSWSGGLVRQELDRSVASWASSQGLLDDSTSSESPLAPEVVALEFRYSDGTSWLEEWDTSQSGTLPVAIEITLGIQPARQRSGWATSLLPSSGTSDETAEVLYYTLVVDLPAAQAASGGSFDEDLMMFEMESAGMSEESP